jgi:hypothetical protein
MDAAQPDDDKDIITKRYSNKSVTIKGQVDDIRIVDVVYHRAMLQLRNDIVQIYKDNKDLIIDGDTTLEDTLSDALDMSFSEYLSRLKISSTEIIDGYRGITGNQVDLGVISVLFNINIDVIGFEDGQLDSQILEVEDSKEIYTIQHNVYNIDKPVVTIRLAELDTGYYVSLE